MERGLTIKEAAAALPCNRNTLYHMVHDGRLPKSTFYHIGTRLYFLPDKIDEWKHNGGTGAVKIYDPTHREAVPQHAGGSLFYPF